ncbi:MAG: hypothetical protein R3Y38_06355 [Rikenellaceae bacterium]
MTDFTIYSGEDFRIFISASDDTGTEDYDLSNYEVIMQLSVDALGSKIIASTKENFWGLTLTRVDNSNFSLDVSHELTKTLSEGFVYLSIMLENKTTLECSIAQEKTIEVKHSKLVL